MAAATAAEKEPGGTPVSVDHLAHSHQNVTIMFMDIVGEGMEAGIGGRNWEGRQGGVQRSRSLFIHGVMGAAGWRSMAWLYCGSGHTHIRTGPRRWLTHHAALKRKVPAAPALAMLNPAGGGWGVLGERHTGSKPCGWG